MDQAKEDETVDVLAELDRLKPALDGFPVMQLCGLLASSAGNDQGSTYRLIDQCLNAWLASLRSDLGSYPATTSDAIERVHARQRAAFDALSTLQATLRSSQSFARPQSRAH